MFLQHLVLPNVISFFCCQIHFGKGFFFFGTIFVVPMKKAKLVITLDDLDFGIKDLTFEVKVFNRYGTFDQIVNRSMKDLGYAYLHYDLLNGATLTIIILRVQSLHIKMYE